MPTPNKQDTLGDVVLTSATDELQCLKAIGPSSLYTIHLSPTRICDYNAWGVIESSLLTSHLAEVSAAHSIAPL
jgi:hypothetical protein